jgi:hypothetical protein
VRWLAVPGDHDVGDANRDRQPVTAARLAAWRRHFGPDKWIEDVGAGASGWRLIGLDAMLIASSAPEEAEQEVWLEDAVHGAAGRRIAWFLHRPLFLDDPDEADTGYWSVKPAPRARLLELVRRYRIGLVASGHLHRAHDFRLDGTRYLWSPASSFLVGAKVAPPPMPGGLRLGAVVYEFDGERLSAEIADVPGLVPYWIDDVKDEVYPRPSKD